MSEAIKSVCIEEGRYSASEIAEYLCVNERLLEARYSKKSDDQKLACHDHLETERHPVSGKLLKSTMGYYVDNVCVYAEYQDAEGKPYSYVQRGKSVYAQIISDRKYSSSIIANQGCGSSPPCGDMTVFRYTSLKMFERAIEDFLCKIRAEYDTMKSCIADCSTSLLDKISQEELALRCYRTVEDIEETIEPAKKVKEKISELLAELRRLALYE